MKFSLRRNYNKRGEPKRCPVCHSKEIDERVLDYTAGFICEVDYGCKRCGNRIGYWSCGYFDPYFPYVDRSLSALLVRIKDNIVSKLTIKRCQFP